MNVYLSGIQRSGMETATTSRQDKRKDEHLNRTKCDDMYEFSNSLINSN